MKSFQYMVLCPSSFTHWRSVVLMITRLFFLLSFTSTVTSKPLLKDLFFSFLGDDESSFSSSSKLRDNTSSIYKLDDHDEKHYDLPRIWLTVASTVEIPPTASTPTSNGNQPSIPSAINNSSSGNYTVRALELHWQADTPAEGDYLALYALDRNANSYGNQAQGPIRRYLLRDKQNKTLPNYIKTDVKFPYLSQSQLDQLVEGSNTVKSLQTPHGLLSGKCLHFYLVYISGVGNKVKAITCIRLQSRWMQEQFSILSNRTLEQIMIPGTHDASSFMRYAESDYEENVIARFQYTQDETLYSQLAYGIRYLDMRVGAYNDTNLYFGNFQPQSSATNSDSDEFPEQLWMVHDIQRNNVTLRQALRQVARFMNHTTHEVVIVDFHRFVNGFDEVDDKAAVNRRLKQFYNIVLNELGQWLIPYSSNRKANFSSLVAADKRILLGYAYKFDSRGGYFDSDLLWPAVQQLWAQTDSLIKLETYLKQKICAQTSSNYGSYSDSIHLQSAMAELTPSIEGVLFLRYHGLRELASTINRHYDEWFRRRWWKCANIVAADFFLGSEVVQIAIDVNRRRFDRSFDGYSSNSSKIIVS